jgi:hypothetical protein
MLIDSARNFKFFFIIIRKSLSSEWQNATADRQILISLWLDFDSIIAMLTIRFIGIKKNLFEFS